MSASRKETKLTPVTAAGIPAILDRFSIEQQAQITRLGRAGDFEGTTMRERDEKTIATLAQAALYMLGLDPLAEDDFRRISKIVLGAGADTEIFNAINDQWQAAKDWTKQQRAAEIGEEPRKTRGAKATAHASA